MDPVQNISSAAAQGARGRGGGGNGSGGVSVEFTAEISFSVGDRDQIQAYYSSNPNPGLEALPPYEVIEVGWDIFLVEAATGIIHDVLMDVIR